MSEELLLISLLVLIVAIIGYRLKTEQWRHLERLAAIEKGLSLPGPPSRAHRYSVWGQLFLLVGLAYLLLVVGYGFSTAHKITEADKYQRLRSYENEKVPTETIRRIATQLDQETQYDMDPKAGWFALLPCTIGMAYLLMARAERQRAG